MEKPELTILYEDNHLIVVLKPQNMPSQGDSTGDLDLLTAVKDYIKQKYDKQGDAFVGLVHRLDRPTGGVMVFARTSKAAARLAQQMPTGEFEKRYLAVIGGKPKDNQARLTNYLMKDEKTNTVKVVPATVEGAKKAELVYRVLDSGLKMSLVDIRLITGRSHQARVQMSYINTPIFGDVKYGDKLSKGQNLALWAYELKFYHPTTKVLMTFKAFPPVDKTPWKFFEIERFISVARPPS
ncbi:MAG: RluA family pseudouridine synthase [Clostridiales bacterium]|jgi:23S rRNA pseudouridine1911/1915/1917 synthase|nr:RluA family pseudouridine synthase [Clostridiales bacterium]